MKCISSCGYKVKPDNLNVLTRHLEECLAEGACRSLSEDPKVIWKDNEFTVVTKVGKKDTVFPISLVKKVAIELTEKQIKTAGEVALPALRGVNATMGPVDTLPDSAGAKKRAAKKIKAKLDDDLI